MSHLEFDVTLNTEKLDAALKKSQKSVSDWADSIEKGGRGIDQAMDRISEKSAQAIDKQKKLIRSIDDEIKILRRELMNTWSIKGLEDVEKRLDAANLRRREAEDSLDRMIETAEQEVQVNEQVDKSQKGVIASLIEWGKSLGVVAAAATFFKAVIASSNTLTETFENNINGARGALQQFFQTFSAGAGQTGSPLSNMVQGFKGARELSEALDAYGDSMRSNQVLEAQEMDLLRQKEAIFRNASKDTEERKAALDEWIRVKTAAAARELEIEQSLNDALVKEIQNRPNLKGITRDDIASFTTLYATDPELMQKAEELQKLYHAAAGSGQAAVDEGKRLKAEIESLLPVGVTFDSLMSGIRINSALNDKQITALADSYKRLAVAQSGASEVESESVRWLGSIVNKGEQAAEKIKDLNVRIAEQVNALNDAITAGNAAEVQSISEKIVALQQELAMRERLASVAIGNAIVRTEGVSKVPVNLPGPLGQKVSAALAGAPKYRQTAEELKAEQKLLEEQLELRNQIVNSAADLISQVGFQIGLDERQMALLNASLNSFVSLVKGNVPEAAFQMLSGLIAQIPQAANRFEAQIERINALLEEQQRLIDKSQRTGGTEELLQGQIELLQRNRKVLENRIAEDQKKLDAWISQAGAKERAFVDMMEATQQLKDLEIELENAEQELNDFLSGGVTQNTIADVIAEGFREGKTSVDDFASYMNDVLVESVLAVFKNQILGESLNALSEQISESLEDKVLTAEEKRSIDQQVALIAEENRSLWQGLTGSLNLGNNEISQPAGLSGAIRREISEQTAGEMVGLMRSQRDDIRRTTDYSRMGVDHLLNIDKNTYESWQELKRANDQLAESNKRLSDIVTNTKPTYSNLGL